MGYSISVKFKDSEERHNMKLFLEFNQSILEEFKKTEAIPFYDDNPTNGEYLAYAPKEEYLLGFNGSGIPRFLWTVCAWMSTKSSVRTNDNNSYIFYDDEKINIVHKGNNKGSILVNNNGIKIVPKNTVMKEIGRKIFNIGVDYNKQTELMNTLNNNWDNYVNKLQKMNKIKP